MEFKVKALFPLTAVSHCSKAINANKLITFVTIDLFLFLSFTLTPIRLSFIFFIALYTDLLINIQSSSLFYYSPFLSYPKRSAKINCQIENYIRNETIKRVMSLLTAVVHFLPLFDHCEKVVTFSGIENCLKGSMYSDKQY